MPESSSAKKNRAFAILKGLKRQYPTAKCSLNYKSPVQLLVSTVLSAQCTDKRVNMTTPALFSRYKTAKAFAEADIKELEGLIKSTGFYRNKAKNIKAACRIIVNEHKGQVPKTMEKMLQLPGVARKTANIVLGNAYGVIEGIPVDTHAIRISRLLGLTKSRNPVIIERDLMKLLPKKEWCNMSDLFVHHGRAICIARRPVCSKCPVSNLCPKNGLRKSEMR